MPRSAEKEAFRLKLIESAAGYLDAGREVEATLMEALPGQGRLVITMQLIPGADTEATDLQAPHAETAARPEQ